jgi:hypothetical protein
VEQPQINAPKLVDTASTLVAGDKGLLAIDEAPDCRGRRRFRLPALPSSRLKRFGKARRRTSRRRSKLCIIEPTATGLRAGANTLPRWKAHENDNKHPVTHETCGMATLYVQVAAS